MRLARRTRKGPAPGARHLRPFLIREWPALGGAALMTVGLTIAELARPWPLKLVIDKLLGGHDGAFRLSSADSTLLIAIAALTVGIALLDAIAQYWSDLWLQTAGERIAHRLRIALYDHLQGLSLRFHLRRQKGDLVNRVTGDVNSIGDLFAQSLGQIAQGLLLFVGMFVVAIILDPLLALVMAVTLPLLAAVSFGFRRRVRVSSKRQRAQEGEIASRANEALSAMPVVKAFGSEDLERRRVSEPSALRMVLGVELARLQARFDGAVAVVVALGTAAIVVVGVLRVAAGDLTAGDLVVFAAYAQRTNKPMRAIAREWTRVAKTLARADRVGEILAVDDVLVERPGAYRGLRARGEIELDRVSFAYDGGRSALHEVSLKIAAGEHVAIIGPSGAGKSTLASLIARFHDPAAGSVLIDGRDARDCSLEWLRRQVGVLLQDTVLFTGTVEANIAYGSEASFAEVVEAARLAAAGDFVESLPEGYDTELGPQGAGLSGGQRQRLGIARTLLRNPPILILDEPTTGLDVESEAQVLEGLEGLMRGRTTLMVTHSLALARRAHRVVVIDRGGIVAEGPPDAVLAEDGHWRVLAERRRRRTRARVPLPVDRGLPQLGRLLDPDAMIEALQRSLGPDGDVTDVAVREVMYRPQDRLTVHYRATIGDAEHDAVAHAEREGDLEQRVDSPAYREVARIVNGRSPAASPVAYDADLDALVSWLPFDEALPALFQPPERLLHRLAWAGLDLGEVDTVATVRYKPRRRAVLRADGHIIKAYGRPHDYEAALAGAGLGARIVPTAPFALALPDLRIVVHRAVDGAPPPEAARAAERAGELLRRLHAAPAAGLPRATPHDELAAARTAAALAAAVVPGLRPRLEALVERLAGAMPAPDTYVACHGDFHVDQLLAVGDELLVVDFDGMCLAPPALDLATYAADVVRGRGGRPPVGDGFAGVSDTVAVVDALEPLLDGYGERPAGLSWYLATGILKRAPHPFKKQVAGWAARVEGTVLTAEEALDA
ncbi:MAG: ATP-binding cassette domain-containing protein [Actinobacteria bacterium]|nr:MAG: ATP-binding cassette domain-containing protein [Actinomycetota bacterium]